MPDSKWYRGEGGGLHEFDQPLSPVFAAQVKAGRLIEVARPGSAAPAASPLPAVDPPVDEDETDADPLGSVERPARADSKAEWVEYAVKVSNLSRDALDAMTKAQLIDKFGA